MADNVGLRHKNLRAIEAPRFTSAWEKAAAGHGKEVPDIRLRAHTAVWAAYHGLHLQGDFVECGVWTGLLSMTICYALDFATIPRTFYLFDSFEGVPEREADENEVARIRKKNKKYSGRYDQAVRNFSDFPNAKIVKGYLPEALRAVSIEKIAYLSIDLNHAPSEIAVITELWDRITASAVVLLDDYAFAKARRQYDAWNEFAIRRGVLILTNPTGQGILIKPP